MQYDQLLNKHRLKVQGEFFEPVNVAHPLWVNRTLYIPKLENKSLIYNYWLSLGEQDVDIVDEQIAKDGFYFGWGNNIVTSTHDKKILDDAVNAVNFCQYYNVVLDHANNQLSKLVGEVFSVNKRGKRIKYIEQTLELTIENANLLFLQLNEHRINLQGHRKKYFEDLLGKWKINAIKENIEKKIVFSKDKLDYFYRKSTKFSSTISESILFGIGGIALVDFFANLSQFSRNMEANPDMGAIENHSFGFMHLAKTLSPDNMIWSGFLILLFLLFVFYFVKKRS